MSSISTTDDFITQTGHDTLCNCPYIKGSTKGIHIYVKLKNMPEYSNQQDVYFNFTGDFIKLNNMRERFDKVVYNYDENSAIPLLEFDDIKPVNIIDKLNKIIKIHNQNKN